MSHHGFDPLAADRRHLTPQQWTALRQYFFSRAQEERNRVISQLISACARSLWRAWKRIRLLRAARAELRSMSERELWDIGLARSGIEAAISASEVEIQPRLTGSSPLAADRSIADQYRR